MKAKFSKIIMVLITLSLCLALTVSTGVMASAEEGDSGNASDNSSNITTDGGDKTENGDIDNTESGEITQNIFEDIYSLLEENADKIFSILAFIGTVVVSIGYKSGLLPLLSDALSKLKGSIDGVKADSDAQNALTEEKLSSIDKAVLEISESVEEMKWQCESYDELCREREKMRLIMQGQIDMLYAIFMSSALPQYQKDEIGERIAEMREELKSYESDSEK
ncbi:MAG: hypothetical protein J6V80_00730 [Clostridia bacterium]|nr:hypothetical protein [Clostridia bacterium]